LVKGDIERSIEKFEQLYSWHGAASAQFQSCAGAFRQTRPALDGDDARRGRLAREARPADGRVGQGECL